MMTTGVTAPTMLVHHPASTSELHVTPFEFHIDIAGENGISSDPSSDVIPRKRKRLPFTQREDDLLCILVEEKVKEGFTISGNLLYEELEANSLRARYIKILRFRIPSGMNGLTERPSESPSFPLASLPFANPIEEEYHASDSWAQIRRLSTLSVDPEHLQELMDELHNEPLPDPELSPMRCPYETTAPSQTAPEKESCSSTNVTLTPFHAQELPPQEPQDTSFPTPQRRGILDLSMEELQHFKEFLWAHQNESMATLLESQSTIDIQDPIFLFLLYQSAGDVLLLMDHLLSPVPPIWDWWTPSLDQQLVNGTDMGATSPSFSLLMAHGTSIPPSCPDARIRWLTTLGCCQ